MLDGCHQEYGPSQVYKVEHIEEILCFVANDAPDLEVGRVGHQKVETDTHFEFSGVAPLVATDWGQDSELLDVVEG